MFYLDGTCSYFHRMEHAADHAELAVLAKEIGAEYVPQPRSEMKEGRKVSIGGLDKSEVEQTGVKAA